MEPTPTGAPDLLALLRICRDMVGSVPMNLAEQDAILREIDVLEALVRQACTVPPEGS